MSSEKGEPGERQVPTNVLETCGRTARAVVGQVQRTKCRCNAPEAANNQNPPCGRRGGCYPPARKNNSHTAWKGEVPSAKTSGRLACAVTRRAPCGRGPARSLKSKDIF